MKDREEDYIDKELEKKGYYNDVDGDDYEERKLRRLEYNDSEADYAEDRKLTIRQLNL